MSKLFKFSGGYLVIAFFGLSSAQAQTWTPMPSRTNDIPGYTFHPSPDDWRDVPLYQIITDRYQDGDPLNNDDNPDADVNAFGTISIHGGDFEGIEQKLDYLQMLGMRGVWISPVVKNVNGIFHGYAAQDLNAIDPHWGTLTDLRNLADALHARGMYLIIDVVQNHLGDLVTSTDFGYPNFNINGYTLKWRNNSKKHAPPFDDLTRFYNHGNVSDWGDPTQVLLGDFSGLDGVRTEDAGVRQDMSTIFSALISATDCDGFRVDTAKHVEMAFWETLLPDLYDHAASIGKTNFLIYCEAWLGGDAEVGPFTNTNRFNSAIYFPMRDSMENVFVWNNGTSQLTDRYNGLSNYHPTADDQLVNFIDNHDMARVLSSDKLNQNETRLKPELVFLYTSHQVPCLYYGTEQGFDGGNDPYDREDMFDGEFEFGPSLGDNFDYTHPLYLFTRTLNLLRQKHPALARGQFTQRWESYGGAGLYAYEKTLVSQNNTQGLLVAVNTASSTQTASFNNAGPSTQFPTGTVLENHFDSQDTLTVGDGGGPDKVIFSVPGYGYKIYIPQSDIVSLPPSIQSCTPPHENTDVLLDNTITINFDKPMDPSSTESAFSLAPPLTGTFTWFNSNQQMVFTPDTNFTNQTRYDITLAGTATSTESNALGAAFQSFFDTGTSSGGGNVLGSFILDGQLDGGIPLLHTQNGIPLYASYDASVGALYVATVDAGEGNDHFILLDNDLSGPPAPLPQWNKNGDVQSPADSFLADENDSDFHSWYNVNASAASATGPNGGMIEGVINLTEQYGAGLQEIYIAVGLYGSPDASGLFSDFQVPQSQNFDQNIDSNEYLKLNLITGEVTIPVPPVIEGEVPLKTYVLDGILDTNEATYLKAQGNLGLYADFNGKLLYVATQDAGEGSDHFILVTSDPNPQLNSPWSKRGSVYGRMHFLADENDSDFEGWFIDNALDSTIPATTPINNGGMLEGTLDLVAIFGTIPTNLYLAVAPYATQDNGRLNDDALIPGGDTDRHVEPNEYYCLDLGQYDTDQDGIPDLKEDLNRDGVMDPSETGARIIDSDGDSTSDGFEFVAGTDGRNSNSIFHCSIGFTNNNIQLNWPSSTGRLYQLQYTDNLGTGMWNTNNSPELQGQPGSMNLYTSNIPTSRIFRIRARLQP